MGRKKSMNTAIYLLHRNRKDPVETGVMKIKDNGININKYIPITIDIPKNKWFCSVMEVFCYEHMNSGEKKLQGVGVINLADHIELYRKNAGENIVPSSERKKGIIFVERIHTFERNVKITSWSSNTGI